MNIPNVEEWYDGELKTLPNGMTVWAKSDPRAKEYALCVGVGAGSFHDPPNAFGCAHFFEHIPFRGSGRFATSLEMSDPLEEHDGNMNAETRLDRTTFEVTADRKALEHGLDVLAAMMDDPHFCAVSVERKVILEEYRRAVSSPGTCAAMTTHKTCFKDARYGHNILGTPRSITRISEEHLQQFHACWYLPGNRVSVIVGPGDVTALHDVVAARFQQAPSVGNTFTPHVPHVPPVRRGAHSRRWAFPDVAAVTFSTVYARDRRLDNIALVLRKVLASGFSSPIFQKLREEKGYFYGFDLFCERMCGFSGFGFGALISPQRTAEFWKDFWRLMDGNVLTPRRLEWVQNDVVASFEHGLFLPRRVADGVLNEFLTTGIVKLRNEDLGDLLSVTIDDLREFVATHVTPQAGFQLTLTPHE